FDFLREITDSIDAANYFLFVLSPNSIASDYCLAELERAEQGGKILVPVIREDVASNLVPEELRRLNWIFLRATDSFDGNYQQLLNALQTADQAYVHLHTRLLVRAHEWQEKNHNTSFVLRGKDLNDAEKWRDSSNGKHPIPTPLHIEYINAS